MRIINNIIQFYLKKQMSVLVKMRYKMRRLNVLTQNKKKLKTGVEKKTKKKKRRRKKAWRDREVTSKYGKYLKKTDKQKIKNNRKFLLCNN